MPVSVYKSVISALKKQLTALWHSLNAPQSTVIAVGVEAREIYYKRFRQYIAVLGLIDEVVTSNNLVINMDADLRQSVDLGIRMSKADLSMDTLVPLFDALCLRIIEYSVGFINMYTLADPSLAYFGDRYCNIISA